MSEPSQKPKEANKLRLVKTKANTSPFLQYLRQLTEVVEQDVVRLSGKEGDLRGATVDSSPQNKL